MHCQKHWQIRTLSSMDGSSGSYPGLPATVSDWRQTPPGFFGPLGLLANLLPTSLATSAEYCLPILLTHQLATMARSRWGANGCCHHGMKGGGEGGQGLERRSGNSCGGLSLMSAALTKIVSHIKRFVWDWSGEIAATQLLPLKTYLTKQSLYA